MTHHHEAVTPSPTSTRHPGGDTRSTLRPCSGESGVEDELTGVDLGHVCKRTVQVGGLALAAYVMTALAAGHGVAAADTGETGRVAPASSSSAHSETSSTDDAGRGSVESTSTSDVEDSTSESPPYGSTDSENDALETLAEADLAAELDADTDLDAATESDVGPEVDPDVDPEVDITTDIDVGTDTDVDVEPDDRSGTAPEPDSDQDSSGDDYAGVTAEDHEAQSDPSTEPVADAESTLVGDPEAVGRRAEDDAEVGAVDATADAVTAPTAAQPLDAPPAEVALGPNATPQPTPPAPAQATKDFSLFGWVRRTFFNRPPTVRYDATLNSQDMTDGVITGNLGAVDPDSDPLTYSLIRDPRFGTVNIDPLTGNFVFMPTAAFAEFGGTDSFTVRVSDNRFHLMSYLFKRDKGRPTARIVLSVAAVGDPASPALEPFVVDKVVEFDLPDGVTVTGAELSPDSEHLILEVEVDGNTHIAVTDLDGGGYQCISCGVADNTAKARAFYDNQRIWFANTSGQQSAGEPLGGAGAITYSVLECEGSIYACQNPTVKKVKFPSDKRLLPVQNREAKPDPFGEYVTWTENTFFRGPRMSIARLVPTADGYKLVDQRIFSPQWLENAEYAEDFADATRFYEGASWHAGGRYLKYQTTSTGLNYDIYLLDTATGERRQLTTDLDYNESGDIAPDGNSIYFSSARGLDRMDVFTALERPSLIDSAAFPQIGRVSLWNNRRSMNEPWLMNLAAGQQQGGYSGQPIIVDPDWTIRGWSWFPDSTRAVINEQQRPDTVTPGAPDTPWRVSIISFPTRTPTTPLPPVHQDPEAIARWSIPVEDYNPMMGRQDTRVLRGAHSGTATLRYSGIFAWGTYSVTYKNYSDDGKTFINGTEKVTILNPVGNSVWSADLTSEGERAGFLKGSIKVGKKNSFSGEVSSEINGVTYSGVPTQTDFPGVNQPQLAISPSGDRIRVTATVAEDSQARPVRGATVTVGSVTMITDDHGYVQIPFGAGDLVIATAGGFQGASHQVPGP